MRWHLKGNPFEVQKIALEKAEGRPGFGYLMEMGLGKSAVFINEAVDLVHRGEADDIAVICPPSLRSNWLEELEKWESPLKGSAWPKLKETNEPSFQIINYEALSGGAQRGYSHLMQMAKNRRLIVGLDESIQIKGPKSIRTQNLIALSPFLSHRRILTGAPITQGPHDAWSQLRFIGGIKGFNYYAFRNRFCKMGGWMNKQVVGPRNAEELNGLLDEWGFRALKADWTDLPEKIYHKRETGMSAVQTQHYREMEAAFITMVKGEYVEAQQVVTQLLKLQQIESGFIINDSGEIIVIDPEPPKFKELQYVFDEMIGKILIFTHFRCTTTLLHERLTDKYGAAIMIGGMSDAEISSQKRRFNEDPSCRAFVIQDQTGKYGHTLLGGPEYENHCSTTVFYENAFDLDTRLQAEDRNHRHGQKWPVNVIDLVASPVGRKAINALQYKRDVAAEVVDGVKKEA